MDYPQLVTITVPVEGIMWLRNCADLEMSVMDAPEEGSEDEQQQEAAWEAIRVIDEAVFGKVEIA